MHKKLGFFNRDMNYVGFALLLLMLLHYAVSLTIYFLIAQSTGHHIVIRSFSPKAIFEALNQIRLGISHIPEAMPIALLLATLIGNIVPFIICAKLTNIKTKDVFSRPSIAWSKVAIYGLIAIGASLFASVLVNIISLILKLFKLKLTMPQLNIPYSSKIGSAAMILAVVVAAPLTEEFICRGVLLKLFRKFGNVFAIVASSLVWALLHGNLIQGIPVFVLGLFFGALALKANSIIPTVIIHSLNNALSLAETALLQSKSILASSVSALVNLSILTAAIVFAAIYFKEIFVRKDGKNSKGFAVFFTCVPILIAVIICAVNTVLSVKRV